MGKDKTVIAQLQADLQSKEAKITQLTASSSDESNTITDIDSKIDEYRHESTKVVEESERELTSTNSSLEKAKVNKEIKELESQGRRLEKDLKQKDSQTVQSGDKWSVGNSIETRTILPSSPLPAPVNSVRTMTKEALMQRQGQGSVIGGGFGARRKNIASSSAKDK